MSNNLPQNIYNYKDLLKILDDYKEKDESLNNFIKEYEEIIQKDKKKPLFSLTSKYSSFPKKKFERGESTQSSNDNNWLPSTDTFYKPVIEVNEDDKINTNIKIILNKITNDNYEKISVELLEFLKKIKTKNNLMVLSEEILKKNMYDSKYQNLYIDLSYKIWTKKEILNNIIVIYENDEGYSYRLNGENIQKNQITSNGEIRKNVEINTNEDIKNKNEDREIYKNKNDIYKILYTKYNFYNILFTTYENEFLKKNENFEKINNNMSLSDEIKYKLKNKIYSIFEVILRMFNKNYTNYEMVEKFINILLDGKVYKETIECLFTNKNHLIEKIEKNNLINILEKIKSYKEEVEKYEGRIKFFYEEVITLLENKIKTIKPKENLSYSSLVKKSIKENNMKENNIKETIIKDNINNNTSLVNNRDLRNNRYHELNELNSNDDNLEVEENTMTLEEQEINYEIYTKAFKDYIKGKSMNDTVILLSKCKYYLQDLIWNYFEYKRDSDRYISLISELYKRKIIYKRELIYTINNYIKNIEEYCIDIPEFPKNLAIFLSKISYKLNNTFCNNKLVSLIKENIDNIEKKEYLEDLIKNIIVQVEKSKNKISDIAYKRLEEIYWDINKK
jgi:hypothetical protein